MLFMLLLVLLVLTACNAAEQQLTHMIMAVSPNPVSPQDQVIITVRQPTFACEGDFLPLVAKYVTEGGTQPQGRLNNLSVNMEGGNAVLYYPPNTFDEGVHRIRIISEGCSAYDVVNLLVGETAYVDISASKQVIPVNTSVTLTVEVVPGLCMLTPGTPVLFSKGGDGDQPRALVGASALQVVYNDQDGIADPEGKDIIRAFATLQVPASVLADGQTFYTTSISSQESFMASDVVIRADVAASSGKDGCPASALLPQQDLRLTLVDTSLAAPSEGESASLLTAIAPLNTNLEDFVSDSEVPVNPITIPAEIVPTSPANVGAPPVNNPPPIIATNTPTNTLPPTATPTNTPLPTDTPSSTPTNTPPPTATNTPTTPPTATNTPTPVPPTATDTPTPVPPTATPTNTALPTNTPVIDQDGDGVPDDQDRCVLVPGLAQYSGCPDTDGDGWPEGINDFCPDLAGNFEGCPDSDGDGWHDGIDACPLEADALDGCPDPPPVIEEPFEPPFGGETGSAQNQGQVAAAQRYRRPASGVAISTPAALPNAGS